MLALALALPLLAAPPAAPAAQSCPDALAERGDPAAPIELRLYLDPVNERAIAAFTAAQTIVAERPGEVWLSVHVVRENLGAFSTVSADGDTLRRWFMTALRLGHAGDVMRLLERQGRARVTAQLGRPQSRADLARRLEIDPERFEAALEADAACLDFRLDDEGKRLSRLLFGGAMQAPALGVSREGRREIIYQNAENQGSLDQVRPTIEALLASSPEARRQPVVIPEGPGSRGRVRELAVARPGGMLVGGAGLPHHLLVVNEDDRSPSVVQALNMAMAHRAESPGTLSIQVVHAGTSPYARQFARRLCAATKLGRELDYLRLMATRKNERSERHAALLEDLDEVGQSSECDAAEDGPDGVSGGTPPGPDAHRFQLSRKSSIWLDGHEVKPSQMNDLSGLLAAQPRASLLGWLWGSRGL